MNCHQFHHHLLAWIEGDLDEATWISVSQHVESCEVCLSEAKRLQRLIETMRAIARCDGVPPIPQRLWQRLTPRRKLLPSFAAIFATACLAFLLGWHARSIASSNPTLQVKTSETNAVSAKREKGQNPEPKLSLNFAREMTNPSAKTLNLKDSQQNEQMFSGKLLPTPTSFQPSQLLKFNGATTLARGEKVLRNRLGINLDTEIDRSLSKQSDIEKGFASDELQIAENDEFATDFVWTFLPVEISQLTEQQPYRIFVQVTDPETQMVRTIKVDTTETHHIVAEWSEMSSGDVSK